MTQGASGSVTYTQNNVTYHASGNAGTDRFTYTVTDGHGGSATADVNVSISTTNQLPVAVNDTVILTANGGSISIDALVNDNDPDGDNAQLRIVSVSNGAKGDASTDGLSITYQHSKVNKRKFKGSDIINYTLEDELGGQATASVSIVFGKAPKVRTKKARAKKGAKK